MDRATARGGHSLSYARAPQGAGRGTDRGGNPGTSRPRRGRYPRIGRLLGPTAWYHRAQGLAPKRSPCGARPPRGTLAPKERRLGRAADRAVFVRFRRNTATSTDSSPTTGDTP